MCHTHLALTATIEDEDIPSAETEDDDTDMEDVDTETSKPRVMGAKKYAQMPLFNHQNGNEQLKPIPRPLPSRASSWGDDVSQYIFASPNLSGHLHVIRKGCLVVILNERLR